MNSSQVSYTPNNNSHSRKIRSAIDLLLSSDSVEVAEPTVKLTECSPDIDVVMNKQGGICTKCNRMFKSRTSLMNHLDKCCKQPEEIIEDTNYYDYHTISDEIPETNKITPRYVQLNVINNGGCNYNHTQNTTHAQNNQPRLIIVPQR